MSSLKRVLSIQSTVVRGYVGNRTASFILQVSLLFSILNKSLLHLKTYYWLEYLVKIKFVNKNGMVKQHFLFSFVVKIICNLVS